MVSMVIWMRDAIEEMNMTKSQPITIYEDNKAAIQLVSNGMSTSDRSRHIHVRNNFVGQFVENCCVARAKLERMSDRSGDE